MSCARGCVKVNVRTFVKEIRPLQNTNAYRSTEVPQKSSIKQAKLKRQGKNIRKPHQTPYSVLFPKKKTSYRRTNLQTNHTSVPVKSVKTSPLAANTPDDPFPFLFRILNIVLAIRRGKGYNVTVKEKYKLEPDRIESLLSYKNRIVKTSAWSSLPKHKDSSQGQVLQTWVLVSE